MKQIAIVAAGMTGFSRFFLLLAFPVGPLCFPVSIDASEPTDSPVPIGIYHLFHPVPFETLRDLATDRPDKTESPFTVDPGHFQIEMDLVNHTFDRWSTDGATTRSTTFAAANLKAGLLPNLDLQLFLPSYQILRRSEPGVPAERISGFGDLTLRLKLNLQGNDGGKVAFGLIPFLKIPTARDGLGDGKVEGGLIFPVAVDLPLGWELGFMTEVDWNSRHAEFVNSITFSHRLVGKLDGYAEFYSSVGTESGSAWIGTFDLGLVYLLKPNVQLDAGINIGVTRSADDFNPFVGITFRF